MAESTPVEASPPTRSVRVEARLAGRPAAVAVARRCLAPLSSLCDDEALDRLRLLVSEVVSNSIRHGRLEEQEDIELTVDATPECVHVIVRDRGVGFSPPVSPVPSEGREHGFGLYLVDTLARRWGVDATDGSEVWFEV